MTTNRHLERVLPELLAELAMGPIPDYRDHIVQETARMRQRPAWTFPERWFPMDITTRRPFVARINWRWLVVAALVLFAVVAAALLAAGSRPRQPAPPFGPAANGLIAYEAAGDIYLGDPTTGASRAIITGPETDSLPAFSRDGTKLFFLRMVHARGHHLMLANADGSDPRVVTPEPFMAISGGDWSGDGRYMLIASEIDSRPTMSIVDTADGRVRTLDVGMPASYPAFRPTDGREIAFTGTGPGGHAIYVVDTNGGQPRRLATGDGPKYSPDGSRIAYTRDYQPDVARNETRVMGADGSNDRVVGDRPDIQYQGTPVWSPDGTKLLLFRNSTRAGLVLAVVPADGTGPGQEFDVGFSQGFGGLGWSPDGSQIVSMPANENAQATVVSLVEGTRRAVPRWYTSSWQRLAIETVEQPTPGPAGH